MAVNRKILKGIVPGLTGGLLFLFFYFGLGTPLLFSLLAAGGGFLGGSLLTADRKKDIRLLAEGITREEYNTVLVSGSEKLNQLKALARQVTEEGTRQHLADIITLVDKIFADLKKDPKDIKSARQFLNYYLDTTINILNRYIDLYQHRNRSEKAAESIAKTEKLFVTIKTAFEKQLEKLIADDILDLDVEIETLEKILQSEGMN